MLASDLTALSAFLKTNFDYDTGGFTDLPDETPAKRFLLRSDYNISNANKVSFRYNQLDSFTDVGHVELHLGAAGPLGGQLELPRIPEHQLPASSRTSNRASASGTG